MPFHCTIVTPEAQVFEADVDYVNMPAHDGQIGLAPQRAPLLVKLGDGPLRIDQSGKTDWFFVAGGFAQMNDNNLTLLTDKATPASDLDFDEAKAMLAESNARVAVTDEEVDARDRTQNQARQMMAIAQSTR